MSESGRVIAGWGRTAPTAAAALAHPQSPAELLAVASAPTVGCRGLIARGLGRSYGDAAQNAGGVVVDTTGAGSTGPLDPATGLVTVAAGTSLDALMHEFVPQGWFVPVSPGTRHVTVGGAIASDIHGKNHHVDGSFCDHVTAFTMVVPGGEAPITVTPGDNGDADLFWATAGGMGLTGVIVDATIRLTPIETSRLSVDVDRAGNLEDVMALMDEGDHRYRFSVAWIDLLARGRSLGRSVLTRGRFARRDELTGAAARDPLGFAPHVLAAVPPADVVPPGLLNPLSVHAFNEMWFRKAPRHREGHIQSIGGFFHPLDAIQGWNRLYGRTGMLQWQIVVPLDAHDTLHGLVERLSASGAATFFTVLKRFGRANAGHLSFPTPGWTLALDLPGGDPALGPLLDELDDDVVEAGGRIYLAKDSRMRPALLPLMYPRLDEWRAVQARVDPHGRMQSDLSRRLGLIRRP